MAAGGWLAGVMYDHFAFYTPAFAVGVAFNVLNLAVIGALVMRRTPMRLCRFDIDSVGSSILSWARYLLASSVRFDSAALAAAMRVAGEKKGFWRKAISANDRASSLRPARK